jgi:ABC-type oligopeptide transport system ATPase subunit
MAGYTRQAAANITTGSVIDAADFNDEYNQVQSAFNASTGHTHDGTAAEGAPIEKVGPSQDLVVTASQVRPKTTNTLDLGTSALQYKDGFFDGTVKTDTLTVDENATIAGNLTVSGSLSLGGGGLTTSAVAEGSNLYFTNARARAALGGGTGISYNNSSGVITCTIDTPAEVGLGNLSSSGNSLSGSFTATGNITAYSDERLKENVETIEGALDKVSQMRGVTYNYKSELNDGQRGTGVIAQEMQQVMPEVVEEGEYLSVAYGNIVGVLIEAVKELKEELNKCKCKKCECE